jgi:hypothetical protein
LHYELPVRSRGLSEDPPRCLPSRFRRTSNSGWQSFLPGILVPVAALILLAPGLTGCGTTLPATQHKTTPPGIGNLVAFPGTVSFASVQVGDTATSTLTLSNTGSASIQVSKIQFSNSDFSVSGALTLPLTLDAGVSDTLTLQFAPSAAGSDTGTMTVTATGSTTSVTVALKGTGEAKATGPAIELESTSVSFGDLLINTPATQSVTITSTGSSALVISAVTVTGIGFTATGLTLPASLNPKQTATLDLGFLPLVAGAATGTVTLTTNTTAGSATIALSGTGVATLYQVNLTWDAPASTADPAVGYKVFRAADKSTVYSLLNATDSTTYVDTTVLNGETYSYYVESVDANGDLSAPSNVYTATIPN